MARRRVSPGRRFTREEWVLAPVMQRRRPWLGALFFALLVLAAATTIVFLQARYFPDERVAVLERDNAALEAHNEELGESLERAMLELEIASVTRAEIERQLVVMTELHKQVRAELEFLKSAAGEGD